MLLEGELFGHEKGSYTVASSAKRGLVEVADGGTLQVEMLRVLEDGSLRRCGATKERPVDVRLLTATDRDPADEVLEGRFRAYFYYRIDVL